MGYITKLVDEIAVKHDETFEQVIVVETKRIAENHGLTEITMNPELVVEALTKQMPMKVLDCARYHELELHVGVCPICCETHNSEHLYCFRCGQKLDWEADK